MLTEQEKLIRRKIRRKIPRYYPSEVASIAKRANKLLQSYDKNLFVEWQPPKLNDEGNVISLSGRWIICEITKTDNEERIYTVETEDNKYRQVDERDIKTLHQWDIYENDIKSINDLIVDNNERIENSKKRKLKYELDTRSRYYWRQFVGNPLISANAPWKK